MTLQNPNEKIAEAAESKFSHGWVLKLRNCLWNRHWSLHHPSHLVLPLFSLI
ncbi:hypothetical protein RHGRI_017463 [Rhododendron griersonianum]|uniref:Uncharacterized protein n=1 Tax=Rhododendron griersonianum TaxID=479676 RepID=A0AAV6JXZ3_9ERIC|nr:hypothetical protein RHGRI_017463 [Rhododendron griersonianum]